MFLTIMICFRYRLAGIRVKTLNGFAKGYDYRPGHQFVPGEDVTHAWNAVFILGAWRFIDTTWGTGKFAACLENSFKNCLLFSEIKQ